MLYEVITMARSIPIHLGETLDLPGGYRLRIVDAMTDLDITRDRDESLHPLPLDEQQACDVV